MTRLPADAFQIEPLRGEEFPPYKVAPLCALATCSKLNVEAHHLVRRSWTVGPYDWVRIGDKVVGNKMPLCFSHHRMVTEDKARIVWDDDSETFSWVEDEVITRLTQPPTLTEIAFNRERQVEKVGAMTCPTCLQKLRPDPPKRNGQEQKRPRKSWTITVPNDAREIGADVLDTLLESSRLILDDRGLSYGHDRGLRYFVLSTTLGLFVMHADEILDQSHG